MVNDYFSQSRTQFLSPHEPILCVGTGFDAKSITDTGGITVPWGTEVSPDLGAKFSRIFLCPTEEESANALLPKFLAGLADLRTLLLPHILLPQLSNQTLPKNLACLQLTYDSKLQPRNRWSEVRWPDSPLLNVHGLFQRTNRAASTNWATSGLSGELLPSLKFLICEVEGLQQALNLIRTFGHLTHLELENVKKVAVWPNLTPTLEALKLTLLSSGFSFDGSESMVTLRVLEVHKARCEIDCTVFLKLQQLLELNVVDSKKFKNFEALLEHPTLRSVRFLDCGKPFQGPLKERFKAHGFERLEIDFA